MAVKRISKKLEKNLVAGRLEILRERRVICNGLIGSMSQKILKLHKDISPKNQNKAWGIFEWDVAEFSSNHKGDYVRIKKGLEILVQEIEQEAEELNKIFCLEESRANL